MLLLFLLLVEREKGREKVLANGFFLLELEQLVTVLIQVSQILIAASGLWAFLFLSPC